jgi:hypothetical protein
LAKEKVGVDGDFEETLFFACAIPFGLACNILANHSLDNQKESLAKVWTSIQNSLEVSFPRIAKKALENVNIATAEDIANGLTPIIIFWPDFALIEASGQIGFLGAIFGLSTEDLEQEIVNKGEEINNWQQVVRMNTLIEINEVLGVFRN